jgi:hypothetical protein
VAGERNKTITATVMPMQFPPWQHLDKTEYNPSRGWGMIPIPASPKRIQIYSWIKLEWQCRIWMKNWAKDFEKESNRNLGNEELNKCNKKFTWSPQQTRSSRRKDIRVWRQSFWKSHLYRKNQTLHHEHVQRLMNKNILCEIIVPNLPTLRGEKKRTTTYRMHIECN